MRSRVTAIDLAMWRDRLDDIEIALVQAGAQAKAPDPKMSLAATKHEALYLVRQMDAEMLELYLDVLREEAK